MRISLVIATVGAATAVATTAAPAARADAPARRTVLSVMGGVAVFGLEQPAGSDLPDAVGLIGATLAWDTPPPDYPAAPGYAVRGEVVPEVELMRMGDDGVVLGGLRLELDIAQRQMGLLGISARSSIWVSGHAGIAQFADRPVVSGEIGATLYAGDAWRFGYWFGLLGWNEPQTAVDTTPVPPGGGVAFAGAPADTKLAMHAGLFVGSTM